MKVFVAMSGGVDSSVAAALLVEAGYDVTGVTMQLLSEGEKPGQCCGSDAVRAARRVCDVLAIPHYTFNMRDVFQRNVVLPFAMEYARGRTPNPCIACNDRVKFVDLLSRVIVQGAEALATGHYARITQDACGDKWVLRGVDTTKDQSYFLYRLIPPALDYILFPLGEVRKAEVRAKAAALGLPNANRTESQETCFVAGGSVGDFVGKIAPEALSPGPIVDTKGRVIGVHRGIARYTVGQRKGLGLASSEPLYVVGIDAQSKTVTVGSRAELMRQEIHLAQPIWRLAEATARVEVQVRYRMSPVAGTVTFSGEKLRVVLDEPVVAVAPGQAVVCYQEDRIVAGGVAECAS